MIGYGQSTDEDTKTTEQTPVVQCQTNNKVSSSPAVGAKEQVPVPEIPSPVSKKSRRTPKVCIIVVNYLVSLRTTYE